MCGHYINDLSQDITIKVALQPLRTRVRLDIAHSVQSFCNLPEYTTRLYKESTMKFHCGTLKL